ncbi:MAG: hypothetical protein K9G62_00705 [Alphaproteobacteria bacterium]|nr:hypothetical protein [Alphaproteobacteria bacterium]
MPKDIMDKSAQKAALEFFGDFIKPDKRGHRFIPKGHGENGSITDTVNANFLGVSTDFGSRPARPRNHYLAKSNTKVGASSQHSSADEYQDYGNLTHGYT